MFNNLINKSIEVRNVTDIPDFEGSFIKTKVKNKEENKELISILKNKNVS
ncbi:MAG: hypothetical protein ACE5J5_01805 [Candidatus Hydrothermarchaeales archaeon]